MLNVILKMFSFVMSLLGIFNNKKSKEENLLKEDKELADAIKRGDSDTVSKIRERRKRYSNLCLLVVLCFIVGCSSMKYKDVPLTQGTIPYQIPSGVYVDTNGVKHNEANVRWSVSEEDLFNNTREIKPIVNKESNVLIEHLKNYQMLYILGFMIIWGIILKRP
jgi:hypothetical protein